jgi:hypothetical protein
MDIQPYTALYSSIKGSGFADDSELQRKGQKGLAYTIPSHLFDGPPGSNRKILIQFAFI